MMNINRRHQVIDACFLEREQLFVIYVYSDVQIMPGVVDAVMIRMNDKPCSFAFYYHGLCRSN